MIEKKIVGDRFTEVAVADFIRGKLADVPIENVDFDKTPMGERVTITTSAPGLVIGKEGANIKQLTSALKTEFKFENPQIKIGEVESPFLSASVVAKSIANDLANFGPAKFKLTGFKALNNIIKAGAIGAEIRITGKIPSARAKSWRFAKGYLKKTGYVSDFLVDKATETITLKAGVVGIQVQIMQKDTPLPDRIIQKEIKREDTNIVEETEDGAQLEEENLEEVEQEEVREE